MRLLADIGGTNIRFALLADGLGASRSASCRCAVPTSMGWSRRRATTCRRSGDPHISEAAIDVATAVTGDLVKLTNSPWAFSIEQTKRQLGLERLLVLNDFTALALSLPVLDAGRACGKSAEARRCPMRRSH